MENARKAMDQTPDFFSRSVGALAAVAPLLGVLAGHGIALVERKAQQIAPNAVFESICQDPPAGGMFFNVMNLANTSGALFLLPLLPFLFLFKPCRRNDQQPFPKRDLALVTVLAIYAGSLLLAPADWQTDVVELFPDGVATKLAGQLCVSMAYGMASRSAIIYGGKAAKLFAVVSNAALAFANFQHTALTSLTCYGEVAGRAGLLLGGAASAILAAPIWYGDYVKKGQNFRQLVNAGGGN